jgi:mycofactocin precursor
LLNLSTPAPARRGPPHKELRVENTIETVEETLEKDRPSEAEAEEPGIVEDICVEELAIDGICGVY